MQHIVIGSEAPLTSLPPPWLAQGEGPASLPPRARRNDLPEPKGDPAHLPRVLVVDDEHIIADTLRVILTLSGFDARCAYNGEQALEEIARHCPDIVLSDVRMPGRDGIETAVLIQQACPSIQVVLFSGQAGTAELVANANREGFRFELWSKPLHPRELVRRLRAL